jgi:hypothetical protein
VTCWKSCERSHDDLHAFCLVILFENIGLELITFWGKSVLMPFFRLTAETFGCLAANDLASAFSGGVVGQPRGEFSPDDTKCGDYQLFGILSGKYFWIRNSHPIIFGL